MKITIQPTNIIEDPRNEVTSKRPFADKSRENKFNPDGIFSERIFGKFGKCTCGALKKPSDEPCKVCGCRVLRRTNVPNFYIKMPFEIPLRFINYRVFDKEKRKLIENLMNYNGFMYEGEYVEFDVKNKMDQYEDSKILAGKEALLSMDLVTEEWYNANTTQFISVPHPMYRKITCQYGSDGKQHFFFGKINDAFMDILGTKESYEKKCEAVSFSVKASIKLRNRACKRMGELYEQLFNVLVNNNRNVVDNELKGQPITGMIRAVMTNNSRLDEDTLIIGKHFIQTLYPKIFEYFSVNGEPDVEAINDYLESEDYVVLFNRQPTIGAKSIIAMRPVFSDRAEERFVIQANPIVYDGLAADVDGDALNVIALYTREAMDEVKKLLPSQNYIEGSNSSIRNAILEEFLYVMKIIEDREGPAVWKTLIK